MKSVKKLLSVVPAQWAMVHDGGVIITGVKTESQQTGQMNSGSTVDFPASLQCDLGLWEDHCVSEGGELLQGWGPKTPAFRKGSRGTMLSPPGTEIARA